MPDGRGGARPGAGRPKGSVSKARKEIASEAQEYASAALQTLCKVMQNEKASDSARVSAATALLDRGFGKPHQSQSTSVSVEDPLTQFIEEISATGSRLQNGAS